VADPAPVEALADLLVQTGNAHHQAFLAANGEDAEWPMWYAEYLETRVATHLGTTPTRSRLVQCLLNADDAHQTAGAGEPWHRFYAACLLDLNESQMEMSAEPESS
jgi:NAD(P)H-hydrate epimerase